MSTGADDQLKSIPTRVLLVDDQMIFAELIRRMLVGEEDIEFHFTHDPKKAVESAVEVKATTILLDINMPGASGFDVLGWLRADERTQRIPVLMLSSEDKPEIKRQAFDSHANDYLVKNPEQTEMIARLRAHSRAYLNVIELDQTLAQNNKLSEELSAANKELQASNKHLRRLSATDGLTGIPNRRCFDEFLGFELERLRRQDDHLSMLLIDVDFFKNYNDNYGHQSGDECLKKLAALFTDVVHRESDLVARYGGEEFAVVLPGTDSKGALLIAQQLIEETRARCIAHEHSSAAPHVTVSIGISTLTGPGRYSPDMIIIEADKQLYKAKKSGRNCCVSEFIHIK